MWPGFRNFCICDYQRRQHFDIIPTSFPYYHGLSNILEDFTEEILAHKFQSEIQRIEQNRNHLQKSCLLLIVSQKKWSSLNTNKMEWGTLYGRTIGEPKCNSKKHLRAYSVHNTSVCFVLLNLDIVSSEKPKWALTSSGGVSASHWDREISWKRPTR